MSTIDCTPAPGADELGLGTPGESLTLHVQLAPALLDAEPERFVVRAVARIVAELRQAAAGARDGDWLPVTIVLCTHDGTPEPFAAALFEAARGLSQVATIERLGVRSNVLLADAERPRDLERSIAFLGSPQAAFVTGVSLDLRAGGAA
jgi:hypothetical protein